MNLVVATYNTHEGVGLDRRFDPDRIARVIGELQADVIALQELDFRRDAHMLDILRDATGFHAISQQTFARRNGGFGNGLLSRFPFVDSVEIDLGVGPREPRGALVATFDLDRQRIRVVSTHLGLRSDERNAQATRLVAELDSVHDGPTVLAGDINDWGFSRRAVRTLQHRFGTPPAPRTFPSPLPLFALDRIWATPPMRVLDVATHRSALARMASDHLPLIATLRLEP